MVDMGLVRQEGTLVPADTAQHHPQHVEAGNHQHGEGHHQRLRNVAHAHHAVHAETDGNDSKQQTDGETAAVAHENLAPVLGLTEDVEIEEHGQRAQRGRRYHGGHFVETQHKEAAKEEKSHHAQARRQAVDAVNQVDGIDDEDDEQHRQRIGHPLRQLMHTKEAVEVVEGEGEGRDVPALFFEGEIWGSASLGRTCDGGRGGECETGAFVSGVLPAGVDVKRGAGRKACAGKGKESGFGGRDVRVPRGRGGGEESGLSGGEEGFTGVSFGFAAKNTDWPVRALSGDIYISVPRVRENARKFHVEPLEELNRVLVHGVLHLAGYKDKTPEEERRMHAMEDEMLKYCFRPVD